MRKTKGIGIKLCKAFYCAVLIFGLGYAFFTNPANFSYDLSLAWAPAAMVVAAVSLWMLHKRSRVVRIFAPVGTTICAALAVVDLAAFGAYGVLEAQMGAVVANVLTAAGLGGSVATALYLAFAPEPKEQLIAPFRMKPVAESGHSWDMPMLRRIRTKGFWRDMLIYFTSFSFMGHWAEMLFCLGIVCGIFAGKYDFREVMLWHQWLFPYLAEAIAMLLVVVLLHPFKEWLLRKLNGNVWLAVLVSVALIAVVCTTIDFTAGMICNQDYSVWDYRDMPFNFMGQVCLQNSAVYTIACTLLVWVVYPAMDRLLRRMPRDVSNMVCISLVGVFAFCALLHFVYVDGSGHLALGMVMLPE